jgi:hypothetical protein
MNIHGCKVAGHIPFLAIDTVAKNNIIFNGFKKVYKNNTNWFTGTDADLLPPIVCANITDATTV